MRVVSTLHLQEKHDMSGTLTVHVHHPFTNSPQFFQCHVDQVILAGSEFKCFNNIETRENLVSFQQQQKKLLETVH